MEKIEGILEDFIKAKAVYLTTFSETGNEHNRQMTNFNDDPYKMMWFPSDRNTQKVKDIKGNSRVLITFPSSKKGEYYEIEGQAMFEDDETVQEKWTWWYLYWHPNQKDRFWFPSGGKHPERVIINVHPKSVRIIKKQVK